jgi:hypothetical protein
MITQNLYNLIISDKPHKFLRAKEILILLVEGNKILNLNIKMNLISSLCDDFTVSGVIRHLMLQKNYAFTLEECDRVTQILIPFSLILVEGKASFGFNSKSLMNMGFILDVTLY